MTTLKFLLIGGGLTLAVLAGVPFALPSRAHVERAAVVPAAPAMVFALVSSARGFDRFNPFRDDDPSLQVRFDGPAQGVGARLAWAGKDGAGTQTIVAVEPDTSVAMQLDLGAMGRPRQTFTLQPAAGGTRVTWALDADFGRNPAARVAGLFMDSALGSTYERGLRNLARVLQQLSPQASR